MKIKLITVLFAMFALLAISFGYNVENRQEVHQYLSRESINVWNNIPFQFKNYSTNSYISYIDNKGYSVGDDLITGSGEEDWGVRPINHFWEPDDITWGTYSHGYELGLIFDNQTITKQIIAKPRYAVTMDEVALRWDG